MKQSKICVSGIKNCWHVYGKCNKNIAVVEGSGVMLDTVAYCTTPARANMVSASVDMYTALRDAMPYLEDYSSMANRELGEIVDEIIGRSKKSLEKARGEV